MNMLKKTLLLAGTTYLLVHNKKAFTSPEPPVSMILRGEYQNKIRRFSPPQKIFDVFASIYEKGRLLMTMKDLLKAICFYNYSMCDESDTIGFKPKTIVKFLGKEDRFQIYDYFVLVRFLAFERAKIQKYFQEHQIAQINQENFLNLLKCYCCKDYKQHIKPSMIMESRQFKPKQADFNQRLQDVTHNIFKDKKTYTYDELVQFRRSIIYELYQFEFLMFPIKDGCIDGVDFARSIVKYVQPNKTKKFMKRIKTIQDIENVKIDKEAYLGFHMYMQTNMNQLKEVLGKKGAIESNQLSQLINKYVKKDYNVETYEAEIVTKLLDTDQSGFLEKREILGVLKNLEYYTTVKSGENTIIENLKKDLENVLEKGKRIIEIIKE